MVFRYANTPPSEVAMGTNLIIDAIDAEIGKLREVRALLSGVIPAASATNAAAPVQKTERRRRLSPAARRRISDAQKNRWAAVRAAKEVVKPTPAKKAAKDAPVEKVAAKLTRKRRPRLSPATKKRIAEAQRKRWAAAKAAKSTPAKKVTKKAPAGKATVTKKAAKKAPTKKVAVVRQASGKPAKKAGTKVATKKAVPPKAQLKKTPVANAKKATNPKKAVAAPDTRATTAPLEVTPA
jgi:hypothetical protein